MANYSNFMDDILSEVPGCPYPVALAKLQRTVRDFCKKTDCYQADLDDVSVVSGTQEYTISDPDAYNEIIRLISVKDENDNYYNSFTYDPPTLTLNYEPTSDFTLSLRASLRPVKGATSYTTSTSADYENDFTDSDLTSGVLTVTHSLNDEYVVVVVWDNNKQIVIPDNVTATDANTVSIDLSGYGTLSSSPNDWHYLIFSGATSVSTVTTSDSTSVDDIIFYNYYDGIVAGTLARLFRMPKLPWTDLEMAKIYNSEYNGYVNKARIDNNKQFTARDLSVSLKDWV